jgi:hypothetical protein
MCAVYADMTCVASSQATPNSRVGPRLTHVTARESPVPIPETQSAIHQRAQRNAFRRVYGYTGNAIARRERKRDFKMW